MNDAGLLSRVADCPLGPKWTDIDEKLRALCPNADASPVGIGSGIRIVREFQEVSQVRSLVEPISHRDQGGRSRGGSVHTGNYLHEAETSAAQEKAGSKAGCYVAW